MQHYMEEFYRHVLEKLFFDKVKIYNTILYTFGGHIMNDEVDVIFK